jgi:hypothetical protein
MSATVNLLDCSREPSDEQLATLMRSVAAESRAKATVANSALTHTLQRQVAEVRQRYHLSPPLPAPSAA